MGKLTFYIHPMVSNLKKITYKLLLVRVKNYDTGRFSMTETASILDRKYNFFIYSMYYLNYMKLKILESCWGVGFIVEEKILNKNNYGHWTL